MQKIKKVLKSLVKAKSKKPEKPEKSDKKDSSKKLSAKAAKPARKVSEKLANKKIAVKPAKKEQPAKKAAKTVGTKPAVKAAKKPEVKHETKHEPKHEPRHDLKKSAKAEKANGTALPKAVHIEKSHTEKPAEKAPVRLKAKSAKDDTAEVHAKVDKAAKALKEEVVQEVKREYVDEEIFLTDADGRRYCRVKECDQVASVDAYCRYHYLLFWKKIQVRKKILTEGKLERYVEELTARYPDKYLEMLRKDLRSEKDFLNAIQELELDDTSGENELEDEAQSYIEEVRGMSSEGGSSRDDDEF